MSTEASTGSNRANLLQAVAELALSLGRKHLACYGARTSRKDFTQPQLMACLILKVYKKCTYRGLMDDLQCSAELRHVLGLEKVPHWTTVEKFAKRANVMAVAEAMMDTILEAALSEEREIEPSLFLAAAMDATGLESTSASAHFVSRSGKQRKKYVKVRWRWYAARCCRRRWWWTGDRPTTRWRRRR